MRWLLPIMPQFRRLSQEDHLNLQASLGYIVSSRLTWGKRDGREGKGGKEKRKEERSGGREKLRFLKLNQLQNFGMNSECRP